MPNEDLLEIKGENITQMNETQTNETQTNETQKSGAQDFRDLYPELSINDVRFYFYQLLIALEYAHEHGVMHRDVKPQNILFDFSQKKLTLIDWGLSECFTKRINQKSSIQKMLSSTPWEVCAGCFTKKDECITEMSAFVMSRHYKAPELLLNMKNYDQSVDIWGAGLVLTSMFQLRDTFGINLNWSEDELNKIKEVNKQIEDNQTNNEIKNQIQINDGTNMTYNAYIDGHYWINVQQNRNQLREEQKNLNESMRKRFPTPNKQVRQPLTLITGIEWPEQLRSEMKHIGSKPIQDFINKYKIDYDLAQTLIGNNTQDNKSYQKEKRKIVHMEYSFTNETWLTICLHHALWRSQSNNSNSTLTQQEIDREERSNSFHFCKDGLELLDQLLLVDFQKRIPIHKAMQHKFFDPVRDALKSRIQNSGGK
ncbi:MAG: putative protein kinase domain [Streblomastix strix]|uniref:non-specific serine/threonine protein kinase n=1 Tax=Streblomastix strix TaxID=222440 RepID=A0A5J4VHW2_9EUKA|nr:MAG: putative protein kinase domain [Streblomastix strix]